jgi:hypothetical protein
LSTIVFSVLLLQLLVLSSLVAFSTAVVLVGDFSPCPRNLVDYGAILMQTQRIISHHFLFEAHAAIAEELIIG